MCSDVTIRATGLGKCYHIYTRPSHRLLQSLVGAGRKLYREFWALRGVDLEVRRGQTLGIIGRNGSGKSTLLQMIAGTLAPTEGWVHVQGRVAALLELGSGFNPDFTGRENVAINAALLGMSDSRLKERFPEILAFADIGDFIDQPVKNYSSGMVMRLAFSVMAHVDADVLIIDEALAVGDAFFTQKCMRFLREFRKGGTLIFVSHDESAVTSLCDHAIWLDQGAVRMQDSAGTVVKAYLQSYIESRQADAAAMRDVEPDGDCSIASLHEQSMHKPAIARADQRRYFENCPPLRNDLAVDVFSGVADAFGAGSIRVRQVDIVDTEGRPLAWVVGGEIVELRVEAVVGKACAAPIIGFYLKDKTGQHLFGNNTYLTTLSDDKAMVQVAAGDVVLARFSFRMPRLQPAEYFFTVAVADGDQESHVIHDWLHEALKITSVAGELPTGLVGIPFRDIQFEILPFQSET